MVAVQGVTSDNEIMFNNPKGLFLLDILGRLDRERLKDLSAQLNFNFSRLTYDASNNRIWQASREFVHAYDLDGNALWLDSPNYKSLLVTARFYFLAEGDNFWLGTINGLIKIKLQ